MRRRSFVGSLLVGFALGGCATQTTETPRGVSEARLKQLSAQVREDATKHRIPGAVILVARDGKVVYQDAIGARDPSSGAPMTTDSIIRV